MRLLVCIIWALSLCAFGACTGGEDDGGPDGPERLVPPGDNEFAELEEPESVGECESALDCLGNCEHSCTIVPDGPFTCPIVPLPTPDRVVDADCTCVESVCAWQELR